VRLPAKRGSWFAAGQEFEQALRALSDASFKVFAYVCLRAERASGCWEFDSRELARELGKSRASLGRCLRELVSKGICELEVARNQHRGARLRVRCEYWPYAQPAEPTPEPGAGARGEPGRAYVQRVREMFRQRACVQAGFGPADERLAADWERTGVSLETVRRAILLGSVRKSMSMIDHPESEPVRSLHYFSALVEEVRQKQLPAGYWQHLESALERCEQYWRQGSERGADRACSNLEQAGPSGGRPEPSST